MARDLNDHFFRKAKSEGYRSRAAYKLLEIDDRRRLLRRGMRVLDAGCAPGSWLQVVAERVGPKGLVVGVDLKRVDERGLPPNVRLVEGDLTQLSRDELLGPLVASIGPGPPFDAIVSDMAPDTTGDRFGDSHRSVRLCHMLLDRMEEWLRPSGTLVMKVFEGEAYPELLSRVRSQFEDAKGFRPKATRGESVEIYMVGRGFRSATSERADTKPSAPQAHPAPKRGRPKPGWGS